MSDTPEPGWYPDPAGDDALRYWDGHRWTEHVERSAAPKRGRRVALATGGGLLVVAVIVAVGFVALRGQGGSAVEIVGGSSETTRVDQFGGTALVDLPTLDLPSQEWEVPLAHDLLDFGSLGDTVYVTTGDYGEQGLEALRVTAYDAVTGEQRWQRPLEGSGGAVVVEAGDESLLLHVDDGAAHSADGNGWVTVIDRNGDELWSEHSGDSSTLYVRLLPGSQLLLQSHRHENQWARVVDLASGQPRADIDGVLTARDRDRLLVRDDERLAVLDHDGEPRWSRQTDQFPTTTIGDGLVYVVEQGRLLAFDADSGEPQWTTPLRMDGAYQALSVPGVGVVLGGGDSVEAFDLDGDRLWDRAGAGSLTLLERDGEHLVLRVQDFMHGPEDGGGIEMFDAASGHRIEYRPMGDEAVVYNHEWRTPGDPMTAQALLVRERGGLVAIAYDGLDERWHIPAGSGHIAAAVPAAGGLVVVRWQEDTEGTSLVGYR